MKFNQTYFNKLYAKGETIDGDFNANDHANYLKTMFQLMGYHASSIYDYGFGKGNLLKAVAKKLECTRIGGCDISEYALNRLQKKSFAADWQLVKSEIHQLPIPKKPYHLGICNSVLQYIEEDKVAPAVAKMAKSCKYLYLHVPTKEDYKILKADLSFEDAYAKQRPDDFYKQIVSKYFHFVSWGLVESKVFTQHKTSIFMDSLYRF